MDSQEDKRKVPQEPTIDDVMEKLEKMDALLYEISQRLAPKKKEKPAPTHELTAFMDTYNSIFGTKRNGNAKTARQLNARLKEGYTLCGMGLAMVEARKEQRHIESKYKWLTPEFFTRPDKLDMYMPMDAKKEQKKFTTYDDLCKKEE